MKLRRMYVSASVRRSLAVGHMCGTRLVKDAVAMFRLKYSEVLRRVAGPAESALFLRCRGILQYSILIK